MNATEKKPAFRVEVVGANRPQRERDTVRVTVPPTNSEWDSLPIGNLCFPGLAPSFQLWSWFLKSADWHEFSRKFSLELEEQSVACECLREMGCRFRLELACDSDQHHSVAAAVRQHLVHLECRRRWREGWIVGGYTTPLRPMIETYGGIWFAKHKVWAMPDRESRNEIMSLFPGDF